MNRPNRSLIRPSLGPLILAAFTLLLTGACDGTTGPALDESTAGTLEASRSSATCVNVKGTGFAAGLAVPVAGRVTASGPIEGDLTGTVTFSRAAGASDQKGNGATFLMYDDITVDSDQLGLFEGRADASINFGLFREGVRSFRGPAHVDITGPGDRHGTMKMNILFDLSEFPLIQATYRYHGRLCGA